MKTAALLACFLLTSAIPAVVCAQTAKPELQRLNFNKLDRNHDGKLSREEVRVDPELTADFDGLDTNHDGFLNAEEFQAWLWAQKASPRDPTTEPGGSNGAQHMPNSPDGIH